MKLKFFCSYIDRLKAWSINLTGVCTLDEVEELRDEHMRVNGFSFSVNQIMLPKELDYFIKNGQFNFERLKSMNTKEGK